VWGAEERKGKMRGGSTLANLACALRRRWRLLTALAVIGAAFYVATTLSDAQGRADLPRGYAVRMTCENDPESYLWSGECDRVAADIARTDKPSFVELYCAFVAAHHSLIPSRQTRTRFAGTSCEPGYDVVKALQGTRFVLEPERFKGVCSSPHAEAIKTEIDAEDRALMTIEREGLTFAALFAGALANLTEPVVILGMCAVLVALWIL
jgi:hypothetical protein